MLQGFIVLFAIITFTIMACDPRPNEKAQSRSAWTAEVKTTQTLTAVETLSTSEILNQQQTPVQKQENEQA